MRHAPIASKSALWRQLAGRKLGAALVLRKPAVVAARIRAALAAR
jgi:hypothetical protein